MRKLCLLLGLVLFSASGSQAQYTQPDLPASGIAMYDGDAHAEYGGTLVCCQLGTTTGSTTTWNWWYGALDATTGTIYLSGSSLSGVSCDSFVMRLSFLVTYGGSELWSNYDAADAYCDPECTITFGRAGPAPTTHLAPVCCPPPQQTSGTGSPPPYGPVSAPSRPPTTPPVDPPTDPLPIPPSGPVVPA